MDQRRTDSGDSADCPRIILHARLCGLLQTIAFKVPNDVVASKEEGRYFAHWEPDGKVYSLQVQFKPPSKLA